MNSQKNLLLEWIERDREQLAQFLSDFIRAKSPNPPGDTAKAARLIQDRLENEGIFYHGDIPKNGICNILAGFDGEAGPGKHLVLNGHLDVFPAEKKTPSGRDSFSGDIENGVIYGRGACDMKAGIAASFFAFIYLHRMRERLRGRLTFTAVSDEETFGPWGAHYLLEKYPDARGDCCLNGEPSSEYTLVFGERGILWLEFTVRTAGAHGAYGHQSSLSAVKVAIEIIKELERLAEVKPRIPPEIASAMAESNSALDRFMGEGSADALSRVHVNIGRIEGGLKVNMMPTACVFETDLRVPVGFKKEAVMAEVNKIVARYPAASVKQMNGTAPSWSNPNHAMVKIIRDNVRELKGYEPMLVISPGGTDCRLWRYRGIPAFSYGPSPLTMATVDEWVEIEDFIHVVKTHTLSACDYLNSK